MANNLNIGSIVSPDVLKVISSSTAIKTFGDQLVNKAKEKVISAALGKKQELIDQIQETISNDNTAQSVFLGDMNRWAAEQVARKKIYLVDGKLIGTKTIEDEPILVDDLLSNNYIKLYSGADGIYIPADEILNRRNYEWFARLSPAQVLESKMIISKYILVANIPGVKSGQIESYQNDNKKIVEDNIKYWRVPLDAPVWGIRPLNLGDDRVLSYASEPNFNG